MCKFKNSLIAFAGLFLLIGVMTLVTSTTVRGQGPSIQPPVGDVAYEIVGQVRNPTMTTSNQYGYLSNINGLSLDQIFSSTPHNETQALFTFFTEAENSQVINNGNLRVVNRTGTTTIYSDATHGDFADENSFRDGTPILIMSLRQQVILDLVEGTFTATNVNSVTYVAPILGVRLAKIGDQFRTSINGRGNTTGTPAMFVIAGYTVAADQERPK
ncbi:MAG TPA: hypothetical protein VJ124_22325 [Pyrinomonadaceae bacterium]|nr:hypothetical protein [Pyrinomonadaceae bacterium]